MCWCDKCTLCDRECQDTEAEGSQATRMSWPSYIPSSQGILAHFTFLHFAASFASFRSPLPLSGLTLRLLAALVCYWPTLLPLGFEKFSLFRHSWDHFNSRRTSDSHPGYCRVQDHQEIQEMPPVVPGEGRGGTNMHTCVTLASAAIDREEDKSESWKQHWHWTIIIITKPSQCPDDINNNMHLSIVTNVKADAPQSNLITPGKVLVDSKKSKDAENCCWDYSLLGMKLGWGECKTRLSFY